MPTVARPPAYPELAAELARAGITHPDLARRIGCSAPTISKIVRGWLAPSDDLRCRIADALGRSADDLFAVDDNVRRLVDQAVAQGFHPTVSDVVALQRVATLLGGAA